MQINLKKIREEYGLSKEEFAKLLNITELFYAHYENSGELPSKYVYKLWTQLEDFPVPEDFFYFTSYTLAVNMKYHNMTQKDVAKYFDIANQSTISGYLKENIPMYEKKEYFLKFEPFILPVVSKPGTDGTYMQEEIRDLQAKGNFILVEKRRIQKLKRLEAAVAIG